MKLPFNAATLVGNELEYIRQAVHSGVISGEGAFADRCQEKINSLLGGHSPVLLTPSCTDALEMCALLLNLGPGDEVVMPAYTFVSTASAFALRGVKVCFADIDPDTLNITPAAISERLTSKTKAIVVVHYGGIACEMDEILQLAQRHNLAVIEDAAHALGAAYKGRALGSLGRLSTFSFHETKNVTCGEGGALVVNDPDLFERANIIRDKGTNRRAFKRGSAAFYTWVDLGSSFVMSDILSAFLYAQLEKLPEILAKRRSLCRLYRELLEPLRAAGRIKFPTAINFEESGAHLFFILAESPAVRERLQAHLNSHGVYAVFHYQPLHLSPYALSQWGQPPVLPVTEDIAQRLLRLPLYFSLKPEEVEYAVQQIKEFFAG